MSVVTIAIMTMIVNKVGVMTPCSKQMFRMINSIKPRAFIKAPIVADSRQFSPANFAAGIQAIPLPKMAIATIKAVAPYKVGVLTSPI